MTRSTSRAFTLIELLVVISILSLLIGLLLPALAGANEAGRAAVCATRVKQLVTAWVAYETDYRIILPSYDYSVQPGYYNYWWGRSSGTGTMDPTGGFLSGYIPRGTVDGCPSTSTQDQQNHYGYTSYGYNWNMVPHEGNAYANTVPSDGISRPKRIDHIVNPVERYLFADATRVTFVSGVFTTTPGGWLGSGSATRGIFDTDMYHGRHNGRGNVVWADGHVSFIEPAFYHTASPASVSLTFSASYTTMFSEANLKANLRPEALGMIDGDNDPATREYAILTR